MSVFTSKNLLYSIFSSLIIVTLFISCQDNDKKTMKDSQSISTPNTPTVVNPPAADGSSVGNAASQQGQRGITHYICANNCVGSGSSTAGNCPICGNAYVHNDAYHTVDQDIQNMQQQQSGQIQQTSPGNIPPSVFNTPNSQTTITRNQAPRAPEPAQNAAGVYHYTCANGCAGGGGSAVACATCGNTLAHNQAYHQ